MDRMNVSRNDKQCLVRCLFEKWKDWKGKGEKEEEDT